MCCDSSFLVDPKTNDSPKLNELESILFEKLDIQNTHRKVIIFSEWIKVHKIIVQMLRKNGVGFTELNGTVPVQQRGALIKHFEEDDACKVFLSTEAGGAGLNLQMADTLINFELPWNPAKKNQRIGRIDRLGQRSRKLFVYNLYSRRSIEEHIAAGLLVKQDLFEGVLSKGGKDFVDFSGRGRPQFIQQLEEMIAAQNQDLQVDVETAAEENVSISGVKVVAETTGETSGEAAKSKTAEEEARQAKGREMETVLTNGMQFLSGLFKLSTGKDLDVSGSKIEVDISTGEVVMRFKVG
jgi:superfamily II DNA/RNA helicase